MFDVDEQTLTRGHSAFIKVVKETETMEGPPGVGPGGDGERAGGGPWPLGSTVLRNQLLRAWGWTVVTVAYHEWERAGTAEAKRAYVGRLLDAAAQRRR